MSVCPWTADTAYCFVDFRTINSGLTPLAVSTAGLETFGLAAVVCTFAAADRAALFALAKFLPRGKLGKLDLGFATVMI